MAATPYCCLLELHCFCTTPFFQDASEQPYGELLTRIARFIPVVLLILVALALYGIALRIQQHGLSVQRIWAANTGGHYGGFYLSVFATDTV